MKNKVVKVTTALVAVVIAIYGVFGYGKKKENGNDNRILVNNKNCSICRKVRNGISIDIPNPEPYTYKELLEDYDWIEQKNFSDYAGTYLSIDDIDDSGDYSGDNYITLMKDGKFKRNHNYCDGWWDLTGLYTIKSANDIIIITLRDLVNYDPNQLATPFIHVFEYTDKKLIFVASIYAFERMSEEDDVFYDFYRNFPLVDGEGKQDYDCSQSTIFAKKKTVKK